ncbi:MAG TPA: Rrf2 family transcriptional regulator [Rhodoblastus sp.]|nr:Rrf2 family transcriptional regulator [Rhodoblastus sp.]
MRLSVYSDLSLRALMYLAGLEGGGLASTARIAERFGVSMFHLQKAIQGLRRLGYVTSLPGRNGGLRLARPAASIRVGALLGELEETGALVDCARGPCPLCGACSLARALDQAERAFYAALDQFTLADLLTGRTHAVVRRLIA